MKRTNGFGIAILAFATMLFFTQCAKQQSAEQSTNDAATTAVAEKSIKVAFVDIDSLLSKYEFSIILNKEMRKRGIKCVEAQDKDARRENPHAIPERTER